MKMALLRFLFMHPVTKVFKIRESELSTFVRECLNESLLTLGRKSCSVFVKC